MISRAQSCNAVRLDRSTSCLHDPVTAVGIDRRRGRACEEADDVTLLARQSLGVAVEI